VARRTGGRSGTGPGRSAGRNRRSTAIAAAWPYALALLAVGGMVVAFWLLPLDGLGPRHPAVSWSVFVTLLTVVAVLMLWQIRDIVTQRQAGRPGLVIPLLVILSAFVFAAAYYALAKQPGEVHGLHTRLDALYFTLVSLSTIGYGDIAPTGQTARFVCILQILYSFVFLTAATTALQRYVRSVVGKRGGG
jgi:voltage-gated potassium channel